MPDQQQQIGSGLKRGASDPLPIVLKLAKHGAYDEAGRIRGRNGEYMEGTSVAKLVAHACRADPFLTGVAEFTRILQELGIEVPNENMRGGTTNSPPVPLPPLSPPPAPATAPPPPPAPTLRPAKRRLPPPLVPPPVVVVDSLFHPSPLPSPVRSPSPYPWDCPLPGTKRKWSAVKEMPAKRLKKTWQKKTLPKRSCRK